MIVIDVRLYSLCTGNDFFVELEVSENEIFGLINKTQSKCIEFEIVFFEVENRRICFFVLLVLVFVFLELKFYKNSINCRFNTNNPTKSTILRIKLVYSLKENLNLVTI